MLDICERAGLLVVEDDPYGQLGFEGEAPRAAARPPPRRGLLPEHVLQDLRARACGSAGSWRRTRSATSWSSPARRRSCARAASPRPPCATYLTHHAVAGAAQGRTARSTGSAGTRMLDALADLMPAGTTWTTPARRPVRLGDPARRARLEGDDAAGDRRPGRLRARHRLLRRRHRHRHTCGSTSRFPPPERIREGVRRLAGVMEQEIAMRRVFGAVGAPPAHVVGRPAPTRRAPTWHDSGMGHRCRALP